MSFHQYNIAAVALLPALTLLLFVGCTTSAELGSTSIPSQVQFTEANGNQRAQVSVNQTVIIDLEGNISTGYSWEVAALDPKMLQQVGDPEFKPSSNLAGAPGRQLTRFKVIGAGESELKLVYHRPWEKDVAPLKTFSITLLAK